MKVIKIIVIRMAHHFVMTLGFLGLTVCHLLALIIWPIGQFIGWSIYELETSTDTLHRLQDPKRSRARRGR